MVVLRKLPRRTQGRKRIEIKKLENASNKQVTFSKRRAGMFKKAAELSVLCGAHVAIIVFSTSGKVFSYGHPTVDSVLDCYRLGAVSVEASTEDGAPAEVVGEFNREYVEVMKELEEQKRKAAEAKKAAERRRRVVVSSDRFWWEGESGEMADVAGMEEEEVEHYFVALEEVRKKVAARAQELRISNGLSKVAAPPVLATHRLHHLPLIGNGFSAHQGGQFGSSYHCFGV